MNNILKLNFIDIELEYLVLIIVIYFIIHSFFTRFKKNPKFAGIQLRKTETKDRSAPKI